MVDYLHTHLTNDFDEDDDLEHACALDHGGLGAPGQSTDSVPKQAYLCVGGIESGLLDSLVEPSEAYWQWLRLILLRILMLSYASSVGKGEDPGGLKRLTRLIRLENASEYIKRHGASQFLCALQSLAQVWEQEVGSAPCFPQRVVRNLEHIRRAVKLSDAEVTLLGMGVLIHAESVLDAATTAFGYVKGSHVPRILSLILNMPLRAAEEAMSASGRLTRSGLLTLDPARNYEMSTRIDLISLSFADQMVQDQPDVFALLQGLVQQAPLPKLNWADYRHMHDRLQGLEAHLQVAGRDGRRGVNILLYGEPGTGKSQLARLLATRLNKRLVSINSSDVEGDPISPMRRTKYYRLAQCVFGASGSILLLDECEELFRPGVSLDSRAADAGPAPKSWINDMLENNEAPAIWICNSIEDLDPAYIRRFDFCLKFKSPALPHRRSLLRKACGSFMSDQLIDQIARHEGATPALIAKTAEIVNSVGAHATVTARGNLALQLLNEKLVAVGRSEVKPIKGAAIAFAPEYVNTSIDLTELLAGLSASSQGRLCVYGPPGTGKTAFGQWLADNLGLPHQVCKASDLLKPHVGETEQAIAHAFERATRDGAVLQFDEVDTFLSDRAGRQQNWEISMVNEMLVQMESFDGVFIASTNLFDNLDQAALRRFDMSLKFDFLRPEAASELFRQACRSIGVGEPSEVQRLEIRKLSALAPGDFHQLLRQARFAKPPSCESVLERLKQMNQLKGSSSLAPMGFMSN